MDYINKIKKLFALKQEITNGFSETEVQKIENKLNRSLPKTLRNYYLNLGANETINYCYNTNPMHQFTYSGAMGG